MTIRAAIYTPLIIIGADKDGAAIAPLVQHIVEATADWNARGAVEPYHAPPPPPPPPWWAGVKVGDRVTGPVGLKLYRAVDAAPFATVKELRLMDVRERADVWIRVYPPAGTTALPIWCRLDECQAAP